MPLVKSNCGVTKVRCCSFVPAFVYLHTGTHPDPVDSVSRAQAGSRHGRGAAEFLPRLARRTRQKHNSWKSLTIAGRASIGESLGAKR